MKNITTLRNHLFDQLERLSNADKENIDEEIKKAVQVVQLSDAILRTAQTEAQIIESVKVLHSAFIPDVLQEVGIKQIERKEKPFEFSKPLSETNGDLFFDDKKK